MKKNKRKNKIINAKKEKLLEKSLEKEEMKDILQEGSKEYLSAGKINNEHDKIFRKILDNKKEAVSLINKALKTKRKIKEEEIEKYNSSFVTNSLKNKEADIIYKHKTENVFFLIEHQTKIDYEMPLRILEYGIEIIKSTRKRFTKKDYKIPRIVPIILYTGRKKWDAKTCIKEIQEEFESYEELDFLKYNLVDVNDYSEEELLKEETFISKAMLIEKTRNTNNLPKYLENIIEEINKKTDIYTKEQKELLIIIINLALKKKLEQTEEMIKKLEGGNEMLAVLEMIEEENKKLLAQGERRGIKKGAKTRNIEIAKKMLEENADIGFIARVTGLTEKTIRNIK